MSYVFTGRDAQITFRDGNRSGQKEELAVLLDDVSLEVVQKNDVVPIKSRGAFVGLRRYEEEGVGFKLSWKYGSYDLWEEIQQLLSGISTSRADNENLCTSPNDYNDPSWTKYNIVTPIGDDGISPDGQSIAQRLQPSATGNMIQYSVTTDLELGQYIYFDVWCKAPTDHTAMLKGEITYHGGGVGPPAWSYPFTTTEYWKKFTAGNYNGSDYVTPETLTIQIHPCETVHNYPLDVWGVVIRRDQGPPPPPPTWDLYIDLYRDGAIDHTIIIEHVRYMDTTLVEDDEATRWNMDFISHRPRMYSMLVS